MTIHLKINVLLVINVHAVEGMTCDELIEALRKEIPDERYKADLKILEGTSNNNDYLVQSFKC